MSGQTSVDPAAGALRDRAPGPGRRWAAFCAGVLAVLLFAFVLLPALESLGPVREVRDAIRRADIDATALFYTECEVSSEAELSIRSALRYAPRSRR